MLDLYKKMLQVGGLGMLDLYKKMLQESELATSFTETESTIFWEGEEIAVIQIFSPTDEIGNGVRATFHKGLEHLISLDVVHVCTCGGHCSHGK